MFRHTDKISQQSHQSAPTGGRMILFICINVIFPVLCSIILDRSQTKVLREEMEENG